MDGWLHCDTAVINKRGGATVGLRPREFDNGFFYQSISCPSKLLYLSNFSVHLPIRLEIIMASSSSAARTLNDVLADLRSVSDESNSSDEEGWEDVEPDDESQPVVGLFTEQVFPDARSMLQECRDKHNFDLLKIQKDLGRLSRAET